jgi:hypothetical protein
MHPSAPCSTLGVIRRVLTGVLRVVWVLTVLALLVVQVLRQMRSGVILLESKVYLTACGSVVHVFFESCRSIHTHISH